MQYNDYSFAHKKPFGRLHEHEKGWTFGDIITPHGIVSVYAQGDSKNFQLTTLQFAINERLYFRRFGKRYTPRGIVTKANEFAKGVIANNLPLK